MEPQILQEFTALISRQPDETSKYPINLEEACAFLNTTFDALKKILQKSFKPNQDYKQGKTKKQTHRGLIPVEQILITPYAFKCLCLMARTRRSHEVRRHFIEVFDIANGIQPQQVHVSVEPTPSDKQNNQSKIL